VRKRSLCIIAAGLTDFKESKLYKYINNVTPASACPWHNCLLSRTNIFIYLFDLTSVSAQKG
jgi:hypothetical protein